jgi:hypothetical protein
MDLSLVEIPLVAGLDSGACPGPDPGFAQE